MSVQDAKKDLTNKVVPYLVEDGCLPEADEGINGASRTLIRAMHKEHGEAWLGNVNLHKRYKGEEEAAMWKYNAEDAIYTFGAAFVAPRYDAELVRLIDERFDAPYMGTKEDYERIEKIYTRLAEIGGENLHWT